MTITRLGFRYGVRTGTPPTYKISLQGVDGSGNPDGVDKTGASTTFTPPADATIDGLWQWKTIGTPYACTRGEYLAIVIAYSSGTVDGSNNSSFTRSDNNRITATQVGLPYVIQNDNGVRTRPAGNPCFGYSSSSLIYGRPEQSFTTYTLTTGTTPDEVAVNFTIPASWVGSYQVEGAIVGCNLTAAKSVKMFLYTGTTVLQTGTHDTDATAVAGSIQHATFRFQDSALTTLAPGAVYRLAFQPQDAAGNEVFYGITQASSSEWQAYPVGTNVFVSTRTDAGAWSDDTATRLQCAIILKDITKPSPGIIVAS